ncbi:lysylphosphatidylglycerol synthase domain-containing protein [Noviherbaspirillum massiliense]|uniref:lysylphosphatidylglycerol synthase domain-containing protein n=1 Tax=Noviherbaspirillum massiliense TaxID=1465823 RepID=UPI00036AB289
MRGKPALRRGIAARPWWPWARRLASLAFFVLVASLLITQARSVQWEEVFAAMRGYPLPGLLAASALAAASYALYSCFDLIGRHVTGHPLRWQQVVRVNFISYAFNLNLGSLIGGVAFRYRLYSRLGLDAETVTRVVAMSMLTNWLGYLLLAGLVFVWRPIPLPAGWKLDAMGLQVLGAVLLAAAIAYVLLCALSRRRSWSIRRHELSLPSLRLALLQLAMSSTNWLLIAGVIFMLLEQEIAFPVVLGVMLVAAIAGVITHVPAGLGVLEAVFLALLSRQLPENQLLAALLTYRAIYYLAPLALATLLYLLVEARARRASPGSPGD